MFQSQNYRSYLALMAGAVLALGACKKNDAAATDSASASMSDTGMKANATEGMRGVVIMPDSGMTMYP